MKFTLEKIFNELLYFDILIKNQNRQIISNIFTNPQTPNCHYRERCINSIPYILTSRICTIVTNKNFCLVQSEELRSMREDILPFKKKENQISRKIQPKEIQNPNKHKCE